MMRHWTFGRRIAAIAATLVALTVAVGIVAIVALRSAVSTKDDVIEDASGTLTAANQLVADRWELSSRLPVVPPHRRPAVPRRADDGLPALRRPAHRARRPGPQSRGPAAARRHRRRRGGPGRHRRAARRPRAVGRQRRGGRAGLPGRARPIEHPVARGARRSRQRLRRLADQADRRRPPGRQRLGHQRRVARRRHLAGRRHPRGGRRGAGVPQAAPPDRVVRGPGAELVGRAAGGGQPAGDRRERAGHRDERDHHDDQRAAGHLAPDRRERAARRPDRRGDGAARPARRRTSSPWASGPSIGASAQSRPRRDPHARRSARSRSRSAPCSTSSPSWPSRPTSSPSTPPSRRRARASRATASPWWPTRSASWPTASPARRRRSAVSSTTSAAP